MIKYYCKTCNMESNDSPICITCNSDVGYYPLQKYDFVLLLIPSNLNPCSVATNPALNT